MQAPQDLLEQAICARERAYSPYSRFQVGVAVRAKAGTIITGCNVENASYGLTICAERVALSHAVSQGILEFTQMVIVTDTDAPTPPCGACRQFIYEFASNLEIWTCNLRGTHRYFHLSEILPEAFGPATLNKAREAKS